MHVDGRYRRTTHGVVSGVGVKSRAAHRRGDFLGFYTGKIKRIVCKWRAFPGYTSILYALIRKRKHHPLQFEGIGGRNPLQRRQGQHLFD